MFVFSSFQIPLAMFLMPYNIQHYLFDNLSIGFRISVSPLYLLAFGFCWVLWAHLPNYPLQSPSTWGIITRNPAIASYTCHCITLPHRFQYLLVHVLCDSSGTLWFDLLLRVLDVTQKLPITRHSTWALQLVKLKGIPSKGFQPWSEIIPAKLGLKDFRIGLLVISIFIVAW